MAVLSVIRVRMYRITPEPETDTLSEQVEGHLAP